MARQTLRCLHLLQLLLERLRVDGIRSVAKYSVPVYTLTAVAVVDKLLLLHRIVMVLDLIIVVHILSSMV